MSSRSELRSRVAAAGNPKPVEFDIVGLGKVFVKVNTLATASAARMALEKHRSEDDGRNTERALSLILVDEDGNLLYDIANDMDLAELAALHPETASDIFAKAKAANRLTPEDVEGKGQTPSAS